jgi:hypothetical protein
MSDLAFNSAGNPEEPLNLSDIELRAAAAPPAAAKPPLLMSVLLPLRLSV